MNPGVSIIIPIYNTERYLSECLNSVLSLTYENLEVIVVNDGSTDQSPIISDEFCKLDKRFRMITVPNGGVTKARKIGLSEAKHEFIMFLDSDDTLTPDSVDYLASLLKKHEADIVIGAYANWYLDGIEQYHQTEMIISDPRDYLLGIINLAFPVSSWAKLYKRDLFHSWSLDLPRDISFGEDILMNVSLADHVKKIVITDHLVYNYRMRKSSVMRTHKMCFEYHKKYYGAYDAILSKLDIDASTIVDVKSKIRKKYLLEPLSFINNNGLIENENSFNQFVSHLHENQGELRKILPKYSSKTLFLYLIGIPIIGRHLIKLTIKTKASLRRKKLSNKINRMYD